MLSRQAFRALSEDERRDYLISEFCTATGVDMSDVEFEYIDDDEDEYYELRVTFPNTIHIAYNPYSRWHIGRRSVIRTIGIDGAEFAHDDDEIPCVNVIEKCKKHINALKRVAELEAEITFLRANKMTLPLPLTDAIVPHLLPELK